MPTMKGTNPRGEVCDLLCPERCNIAGDGAHQKAVLVIPVDQYDLRFSRPIGQDVNFGLTYSGCPTCCFEKLRRFRKRNPEFRRPFATSRCLRKDLLGLVGLQYLLTPSLKIGETGISRQLNQDANPVGLGEFV